MTPAERSLFVAIGEVIANSMWGRKIKNCVEDVKREDEKRPEQERMRPETLSEYNERVSR